MTTVSVELPKKIHVGKGEFSYNDFIDFLSKKSVLDDIQEATITFEGVASFDLLEEKKLMSLKSIKSLMNAL